MKKVFLMTMLLMVSMIVSAQQDEQVPQGDQASQDEQTASQGELDVKEVAVDISDFTGGTVSVKEKKGQNVTITVKPDNDYYIEMSDVTVIAVKDPATLTRSDDEPYIPVGSALTLKLVDDDGNPVVDNENNPVSDPENKTLSRNYMFTVPEGLGAWVSEANFHEVDKPVTSGKLNTVLWEVTSDETTTTLTLSGSGAAELLAKADAPWNTFDSDITNLVVEEGIEALGNGLLASCPELTTITLKGKKLIGLGDNTLTEKITVDVYGRIYNEYKADKNWGAATITSSDSEEMKGVAFGKSNDYDVFVSEKALLIPSKLSAFIVTAIDGNNVKIEEITDGIIPAGVPVLLFNDDLEDNDFRTVLSDKEGTVSKSLLKAAPSGGKKVTLGEVYLLYNDVFYLSMDGTIPENGVYLPLSDEEEGQGGDKPKDNNKTRSFLTIGDDATTAIIDVKRLIDNGQLTMDKYGLYGLDGRRLITAPSRKGIYIKGSKKVVLK